MSSEITKTYEIQNSYVMGSKDGTKKLFVTIAEVVTANGVSMILPGFQITKDSPTSDDAAAWDATSGNGVQGVFTPVVKATKTAQTAPVSSSPAPASS